ncbi:hypothetical protein TNCV_1316051 [Trichonephila clavipes]|nr:hypothetical protein TNCV_1316051 [Trichonephila clavipes]
MVWDVFWEFPAFWVSYGPREDIPPLTSDQSEKLIVFREKESSPEYRPCCCLQAEEFLGVPLTPPKKGDAFPTPGRRQCTHKYIMVWDVFWEFPAFWVSYGPREDIPPLTSDQSEKLIVFRERVLSRIHRTSEKQCCCHHIIPELKEGKLPEPETGKTSNCTPVVARGLGYHTGDCTIVLARKTPYGRIKELSPLFPFHPPHERTCGSTAI